MSAPIPNSCRASSDPLFAGEYPGDPDTPDPQQKIGALFAASDGGRGP